MKSPFPGMDPYIESCRLWGDFHHGLIGEIRRRLADVLPQRYFVRSDTRSYLAVVDSEEKIIFPTPPYRNRGNLPPDEQPRTEPTSDGSVRRRAFIEEEHRESFLNIYDAESEQRVVTTIQILSPSNKRRNTLGWELYQTQRRNVLLSDINLMEIDLLRGGERPPMLDPWPDCPYTLLVARAKQYENCRVWPAHFQRPLPEIPVPLAKPDADIPLHLQPMIEAIYQRARYGQSIDYRNPLNPPLNADETKWLKGRLRERQSQT